MATKKKSLQDELKFEDYEQEVGGGDLETPVEGWLTSDPVFGGMFDGAIKTSAEKNADIARRNATRTAENDLKFNKGVHEENQASWNDLESDLFGRSPEDLAQGYADERAASGGVTSQGVTTPSGRQGRFDFGTPNTLVDGGGQPSDDQLRGLYDSSRYHTEEEFKKRVQALEKETGGAALSDSQIRNLYDTGRNGSFDDYKKNHVTNQVAGNQDAVRSQGTVTKADRDRAAQTAQAGYKNTLPGQLDTSRGHHKDAVDKLIADLDGIQRVDPGEYNNDWNVDDQQEYISADARNAQKQAMDKTFALTDTKETAEEKFMREMARRNMETDLRGQREAQASNLRTRGAYGSGAELAGFLGSQQELAQRRSLEEMGANANAAQRSLKAIGQYSDQGFQLGQQDLQQGGLQDVNSRFNSDSQQNFQKHKTKTQQEENQAESTRIATKADASTGLSDREANDTKFVSNTKLGITGGKTNSNLAGAAPVSAATRNVGGNFAKRGLELDADDAANSWGLL